MIRNYLRKLFSRDYGPFAAEFAQSLGYETWKEAQGNSYVMFFTQTDDFWFATELPDCQWAVWKEEVEMPYSIKIFSTVNGAIEYLWELFVESSLPEHHWLNEVPTKKLGALVDEETQIQILLYGDALTFACDTLGVKDMKIRKYVEVFTVNTDEVFEYVLTHGLPQSEPPGSAALAEGFHYYKKEGEWITFFTERGRTFNEKNFDDEEEGKRYIVTTLLQLSGTGLY